MSFADDDYVVFRIATNVLRVLKKQPAPKEPLPTTVDALRRFFFFHFCNDAVITTEGKILSCDEQCLFVWRNFTSFLDVLGQLNGNSLGKR
jgi:hypothetical protein